jgi:hypothetical protein
MTGEWTVTLTFATYEPVTDEQLDLMADVADQWDAVVAARGAEGSGVTFRMDVETFDIMRALEIAQECAHKALDEAQIDPDLVAATGETPELAELRAMRPDTPELLAATDVAEVLDVSRQRVHQLATGHKAFPAPFVRLGSGPVWTRPAIEHFASVWDRKPGRPAKAS